MARVVVRDGRLLRNADPSAVWALVADPTNLDEWAPVHQVGFLGTEIPAVGHVFFLTFRRSADPVRALRCRIVEWEAGHRIRIEVEGSRVASDERVDVVVSTEIVEGKPATDFELRYEAVVKPWAAAARRIVVGRGFRRAVRAVERTVRA